MKESNPVNDKLLLSQFNEHVKNVCIDLTSSLKTQNSNSET